MAFIEKNMTRLKTVTTDNGMQAWIHAGMLAAGWTAHDTISATQVVYRSVGESGVDIPKYIKILYYATSVNFSIFGHWNASTHVGTCGTSLSRTVSYGNTGWNACITLTASANGLLFLSCSDGDYSAFAQSSALIDTVKGIKSTEMLVTAAIPAGNDAIIKVADNSVFKVGQKILLIEPTGVGRYEVTIKEIVSSTDIKVVNVPVAMGLTTLVCIRPARLVLYYSSSGFMVFDGHATGTLDTTSGNVSGSVVMVASNLDPSLRQNTYTLQGVSSYLIQSGFLEVLPISVYGDEYILYPPILTAGDMYFVGDAQTDTVVQATSATSSTVTVAGAGWTVDEWKDKFIAVHLGTAIRTMRKISGNTADTITFYFDTTKDLDSTSVFYIVDRIYVNYGVGGALRNAYIRTL